MKLGGDNYKLKQTLIGHKDWVISSKLMGNDFFATGSYDKTIRKWKDDVWTKSWQLNQTLNGHMHDVNALAVLDTGELISGSLDKTIKFWDCY